MAEKELEDLFGGADETPKQRASRVFEENAPFAAAAIIDLVIWILAVAGLGFSAPSWVPASAVLCLALALWIP
jgi:hypothetical protein